MTDTITPQGTSRLADVEGLKIHYHDVGEGPPLLMLHGGGPGASGWSNFKQNLAALAPHFRIILMDQPGFGSSDKPDHDEPQWVIGARAIVGLLDHLGLDQVTPVGNSMGGACALELALEHPDRVDRLILMAPAGGYLPVITQPHKEAAALFTYYLGDQGIDKMKALVKALMHNPGAVSEETLQERFEAAADPDHAAYNQKMFLKMATSPPMHWTRLAEIRHPTLLMWGREDKILSLDGSLHMLKQIRNARLVVFPNCGHWCQVEAQQGFEQAIISFMSEDSG